MGFGNHSHLDTPAERKRPDVFNQPDKVSGLRYSFEHSHSNEGRLMSNTVENLAQDLFNMVVFEKQKRHSEGKRADVFLVQDMAVVIKEFIAKNAVAPSKN